MGIFKFKSKPPQMKDLYVLGSKSNKLIDLGENSDVAIKLKTNNAIFTVFNDFYSSKSMKIAPPDFKSMATSEFSTKSTNLFDFDPSTYKSFI